VSEIEHTACLHCDLPVTVGALRAGERAACPRCGHLVSSCTAGGLERSLAFALAAFVLLALANTFPFLAFKASGLESVMTLPNTAVALYRDGYASLAVVVLGLIVVIPALILGIIVALAVPLLGRRKAPWLVPAGRALFLLTSWSMVEVFVIGVIVSLVKIAEMATVVLGISFWSYVGFGLCFVAALSSVDRLALWREIERCTA
jgi:paraquat-inducible protein A